jgi:glutathione S-transferase
VLIKRGDGHPECGCAEQASGKKAIAVTDENGWLLFIAPRSPFCRKILAAVVELGLEHRVDLKIVDPWTCEGLRAVNALCKVPSLLLPDGTALFDSRVITQYLQAQSAVELIPQGNARWDALCRESLADGIADAVIRRFVDRLGPENERVSRNVRRQEQAIDAALNRFEQASAWMDQPVDIGHIALACAIDYLGGRSPELTWHQGRPLLTQWFYDFRNRLSLQIAGSLVPGHFRTIDQEPFSPSSGAPL